MKAGDGLTGELENGSKLCEASGLNTVRVTVQGEGY